MAAKRLFARPVPPPTITFEVLCNPLPKERPRFGKWRCFTPRRTVAFEETVARAAKAAGCEPWPGPVHIDMDFRRSDKRRVDLDNLVKSIWDALNGVAFADDSQVVFLNATKEIGCAKGFARIRIMYDGI